MEQMVQLSGPPELVQAVRDEKIQGDVYADGEVWISTATIKRYLSGEFEELLVTTKETST